MNLTISDFQKIANGSYNAGDITLTSSGKLDKVNNHVGILKGWNNKTISATTTLEVKNAFVKAHKLHSTVRFRCSAAGFRARGVSKWHERICNIYSKTYTEGSDPFAYVQRQRSVYR